MRFPVEQRGPVPPEGEFDLGYHTKHVDTVFQRVFGYSREKAHGLMLKVHNDGRAVVSSGSRDKVENDVRKLQEAKYAIELEKKLSKEQVLEGYLNLVYYGAGAYGVEAAAQRLARSRVMHRPILTSWGALLDYCHTAMAHREIEQFRVLYLDRKNVLIADEEQARGTVDHVPVYPREIMRRALELTASALILVHNHPSGDPTPSEADISMTARIVTAGEVMGIAVHDHLIIGKSRELSFRSEGLL